MGMKWTTRGLLLGGCLLIVVWALGCGDTGPQGPPGKDGKDAATTCFNCHSDNPADSLLLTAKIAEWRLSLHGSGDTWEEKSTPCNGCHTHEGFLDRVAAGMPPIASFPLAMSTASRINCWTCHRPHTSGDFTLRTQSQVTLFAAGGGTVNIGEGNLCAACHQARPANPPLPTAVDTLRVKSTRWGPHEATQANMLTGQSGFFSTANPATSSYHTTLLTSSLSNGCVVCHMKTGPTGNGQFAGGHTWKMAYETSSGETEYKASCYTSGCHTTTGLTSFDYKGVQTEISGLLQQVKVRLFNAGIVGADSVHISVPNTTTGKVYTTAQLKAVWNLRLVLVDRSLGIHNTAYARNMLKSCLDFVPAVAKPAEVAQK